jgi:hypothetical protein
MTKTLFIPSLLKRAGARIPGTAKILHRDLQRLCPEMPEELEAF